MCCFLAVLFGVGVFVLTIPTLCSNCKVVASFFTRWRFEWSTAVHSPSRMIPSVFITSSVLFSFVRHLLPSLWWPLRIVLSTKPSVFSFPDVVGSSLSFAKYCLSAASFRQVSKQYFRRLLKNKRLLISASSVSSPISPLLLTFELSNLDTSKILMISRVAIIRSSHSISVINSSIVPPTKQSPTIDLYGKHSLRALRRDSFGHLCKFLTYVRVGHVFVLTFICSWSRMLFNLLIFFSSVSGIISCTWRCSLAI